MDECRSTVDKAMRWLMMAGMAVVLTASYAGEPAGNVGSDAAEAVIGHAVHISAIGPHPVGSAGEQAVAEYVQKEFEDAGLETTVETFQYRRFVLDSVSFYLGETAYPVQLVGFDPYGGPKSFSGDVVLVDTAADLPDVKGRVVVLPGEQAFFGLMLYGASMIVCLEPTDFEAVQAAGQTACRLNITGRIESFTSRNVIGILPATTDTNRQILLTCHMDGYRDSPGANDNGTGMGTLIELAKQLNEKTERSRNVVFAAFGGEEVGLLGSRTYFVKHAGELANMDLIFNVDTIGGTGDPRVEMDGGVADDYAERGACHFPDYLMDTAWEGANGKWRICHSDLLRPLLMSSQVPDWLGGILRDVTGSAGFKVDACGPIFSDGRIFAQAGVPTSGVAQKAGSKLIHSSNDTPENLHPALIRKSIRLTDEVITATLDHFSGPDA